MPKKSGSNEQARERSRALLLQAGADILLDQALQNPFATLRLRALCSRAGLSTGAFYIHWRTLQEFYDDLARHLTEEDELAFQEDFATLAGLAESDDQYGTLPAITHIAENDLRLLSVNPVWDAMELVALTWGRTQYREQLRQGYETIDRTTGQIYGTALAKRGREPRAPFDWDSIGTILQALAEGLGLRQKIDPDAGTPPTESIPGLYAIAAAAVLASLTCPVGDQATVEETLVALLDPSDGHESNRPLNT